MPIRERPTRRRSREAGRRQHQGGHTDPTLTLRIYQRPLKRKRREEYRERVNELLGTSPAALSKLPEVAGESGLAPNRGPQLAVAGRLSPCDGIAPSVSLTAKGLQMPPFRRRVSDGTRTRDRLDHNQGVKSGDPPLNPAWQAGLV
jgi:hypothetical protein